MTEIIDRVAAGIATFSTGSADNYKNFRDEARAAIEAMMEPTPEMVEAGRWAAEDDGPLACWQAMLGAALATPETGRGG